MSAIVWSTLHYLGYGLAGYFVLAIVLMMLDRLVGVRLYRWYYNRAILAGEPMPAGMMGLVYNQSWKHQIKTCFAVSVALSLLVVYFGSFSLLELAIEAVIAMPFEAFVMIPGFWVGNFIYDAKWRRIGERSSIQITLSSWRASLVGKFGLVRRWLRLAPAAPATVSPAPVWAEESITNYWQWQQPSFRRFLMSFWHDAVRFHRRRPFIAWAVLVFMLCALYVGRHEFQPLLLTIRIYGPGVVVAVGVIFLTWWLFSRSLRLFVSRLGWRPSINRYFNWMGAAIGCALIFGAVAYGRGVHDYMTSYVRYGDLQIVTSEQLPLSSQERLLPRQVVEALARGGMYETEQPTQPHFVRMRDGSHQWTMAVVPSSWWLRFVRNVEEVLVLPATVISPVLRRQSNARFDVGENLLFSRNIATCVERGRWFWQSATSTVGDSVINLQNDEGQWVQVVPIVRWRGLFFPYAEFGGVVVVDQQSTASATGFIRWMERVVVGCGRFISPSAISEHAFLRGQNIVPYEVSRVAAESLRFRRGFWAPHRAIREGDLRIADLPGSINIQPFALYFSTRVGNATQSKIYHYISLEPRNARSRALAVSFWMPADGIGPSVVYEHFGRAETLAGATSVPDLVRSAFPEINWSNYRLTEPTPYLREIADAGGVVATRFLWLVAGITEGADSRDQTVSQLFIVEPSLREVVRLNLAGGPQTWPEQIRARFGEGWGK